MQKGRRTKSRHGKKGRFHWPLLLVGAVVLISIPKAWQMGSEWIAVQNAIREASAVEEPAEDFRPDVGEPPYTIAVDAGHGGDDPGATGIVVEKDMTAQTAEDLMEWLRADPNYIPVTTRESYDTTATPMERAEASNHQHPDLLLSIHGNSAAAEASGFECYPITPGRVWHRESVYFARLLASGMEAAGSTLRGQGGVRYIYYQQGQKVLAEVIRLGDRKKNVSPSDLPFIIAGVLSTPVKSRIRITDFEVTTRINTTPKARVVLEMDGEMIESTASGDGGYDAFVKALRKSLKRFGLSMPRLLDYEERIPPGGKTDALVETTIRWATPGRALVTTGIDSDQLVSAVLATEKMLNLILPE